MEDTEFETLLDDVKNELCINWVDEKTDSKITGYIKRGMSRLTKIAGVDNLDFKEEGLARELLFDYCRYAFSQALEVWEDNFQSELLQLHFDYQAQFYKEGD